MLMHGPVLGLQPTMATRRELSATAEATRMQRDCRERRRRQSTAQNFGLSPTFRRESCPHSAIWPASVSSRRHARQAAATGGKRKVAYENRGRLISPVGNATMVV